MAHSGTVINVGGEQTSGFGSTGHSAYTGQADHFGSGPYGQKTTDLGTFKVGGSHGSNSSFVYHPTSGSFTSGATFGGPSHGPPVRMIPDTYSTSNTNNDYSGLSSKHGSSVIMVGSEAPSHSYDAESTASRSFSPAAVNNTTFAKNETSTISFGNPGKGFEMMPLQMPISTGRCGDVINYHPGSNWNGGSLSPPQTQIPLFSPEPRRDAPGFPVFESTQSFPSSRSVTDGHHGPTSVEFSPLPDGAKHGGSYKFESKPQIVLVNQEGNIQQHGSKLTPNH